MSRTYRNILKTKQCERFYNLSPRIYIFDLDGTIIDSSHRATHDEQGNIDLENWKEGIINWKLSHQKFVLHF